MAIGLIPAIGFLSEEQLSHSHLHSFCFTCELAFVWVAEWKKLVFVEQEFRLVVSALNSACAKQNNESDEKK